MTTIVYDSLLIGGGWAPATTDNVIDVLSANTGQPIGRVPDAVEADMDAAVAAARAAFDARDGWATWAPRQRAEVMVRLAEALETRSEETSVRVSSQNGMPITTARPVEGAQPAQYLRYYADLIVKSEGEEERGSTLVRREPIGVAAAIPPFNAPQVLSFLKIAPALAAGCTLVVKPPPETVLDFFLLAEAVMEAGVPEGVINIVPGGRETGAYLVSHPGVDKVSFTGSTAAGRQIGATCGQLLRPVTLELGGKSAAIILDDAKLSERAEQLFAASFLINGQTCFASTRILAPANRYDEVVDFYTSLASTARVGDSLDPTTQIGPMVSARQRDRVESYIAKGLGDGARLTTGGGRPDHLDQGWFVQPTIFADVDNGSVIAQEEIFGPVLVIIRYDGDDDAVRLANDSDYGLGGTVWTEDTERGIDIARRIATGTIGINGYFPAIDAPYGGMKASGMGRENGPEGMAAYQQFQSIYRL
jgi:acyl-CoA reductase-like NAD-dependent aldehyde dehydrogenase